MLNVIDDVVLVVGVVVVMGAVVVRRLIKLLECSIHMESLPRLMLKRGVCSKVTLETSCKAKICSSLN